MQKPPPDSLPTRFSLLQRLKDWADQDSWREFFETYWELIYNVARKAGLSDAQAQEVVQETVIAVAKNIGEFKTDPRHGSFKAWLLQQSRWQIARQFRQASQASARARFSSATSAGPSPSEDPSRTETLHRIPDPQGPELERVWDEEWSRNRTRAALERVKQRVSIRQYQVFDLNVLQGMSAVDTAKALGVSTASVYMAKYRVGALLKKELQKMEGPGFGEFPSRHA